MDDLAKHYRRRQKVLFEARNRLRSVLLSVIAKIEDKKLVRVEVGDVRVKELTSLRRKAEKNGWQANEALSACGDLVGGRVVCNNTEDVYRFVELLREALPDASVEVQDQIDEPNSAGYRALHVNLSLGVGADPFRPELVPCEIQIRTRLQDAWAVLSHDDIYKQQELPEDVRARFKDLSEILAAADHIASDIRRRVAQRTAPPDHRPDINSVSREVIAYIFSDAFGRSAADYVIREAFNICQQHRIKSLKPLPSVLRDREFRQAVADAYQSIMPGSISVEDFFLAGIRALGTDKSAAIKQVRREAKREWDEIDQFARREVLHSLPATIEELIDDLKAPEADADIEGWAEALGVTHGCAICGSPIVDPYAFAEAVIQHYGAANDLHNDIETAVRNSSVETGGWADGTYCAYHNDRLDKD
jgi:ppGpp synthetase/RelA/SpoT-type nucleotidyltranferase